MIRSFGVASGFGPYDLGSHGLGSVVDLGLVDLMGLQSTNLTHGTLWNQNRN